MKLRSVAIASLVLVAVSFTWGQRSEARVRRIILSTQHLGAHGMGYNTRSLWQLSKRLTPDDVPVLLSLGGRNSGIAVGAQFGLASQCGSAIVPVRDVAVQHKLMSLDAEDTLLLISEFEGCSPEVRSEASAAKAELHRLFEEEHQRIQQEAKQKADDDSRIQANGLKLLDPEKAKTLTREERLEIYHRSLAAMGLKEDGPMTPDQKKLVDRMYRSMVLGEVKTPPNE
jgi:hypothetical protein